MALGKTLRSKSDFRENGEKGIMGEKQRRGRRELGPFSAHVERPFMLWSFGGRACWMVSDGVTWEGTEWNSHKITFYLDPFPQIKHRSS